MEEKILREILSVTKENNEMLKQINFQRKWSLYIWIFKWTLVILLAYSAYRAATPYIEQAQATLDGLNSFSSQAKQYQNMDQKSFIEYLRQEVEKRLNP